MQKEWIGVGLDGTLAKSLPTDPEIGQPIPIMVARVLTWLREGQDVRIVTPRIAPPIAHRTMIDQHALINEWCWSHFKQPLPVTATISHHMQALHMHNCFQAGQPIDQS